MKTRIIKISSISSQIRELEEAAGLLREGQCVAFPTETVYGLGALGLHREAVELLYNIKSRPREKALSLQVATIEEAYSLVREMPPEAEALLEVFCPGPLTLVLPKSEEVPDWLTGGQSTVGIRIPSNPITLELLRLVGKPLAVPSANISGHPSPLTAQEVYQDLQGKIPLILDGGSCNIGRESTIVDCSGERLRLLRQGAIAWEELNRVLVRSKAVR